MNNIVPFQNHAIHAILQLHCSVAQPYFENKTS